MDYEETFAAVAKSISWKVLLALAVLRQDIEINQMDIVTAFLYSFLDKIIYMEQPYILADGTTKVYKLIKTLYGLKQSLYIWYETLADFLKKLGLYPSELDPAVFMTDIKDLFLSIYMDNLLIFSANRSKMESLKVKLSNRFKMTDLGLILYYLSIEVDITDDSITIRQTTYFKKVLARFQIEDCEPKSILIEPGLPASCLPYDGQASKDEKK